MRPDSELERYTKLIHAEAVALCAIAAELQTDVRELVAAARKRRQSSGRENPATDDAAPTREPRI